MSKGIGALQRRLLAAIEVRDPPMAVARDLISRELEGLSPKEAVARVSTVDVSVRRALRGLVRRGLLVDLGRIANGWSERPTSAYTTPAGVLQFAAMDKEVARGLEFRRWRRSSPP